MGRSKSLWAIQKACQKDISTRPYFMDKLSLLDQLSRLSDKGMRTRRRSSRETAMQQQVQQYRGWRLVTCAALAGVSLTALTASQSVAQYKITVNKERLINAQNEPQNWLMMNGDYSSSRYSKLTQINRENVKRLRMVWALALGGMQDVKQNGPEAEVHPLIDNGFMYTSDGWGTVYKIDARNSNKGEFVWVS